MYTISHTRTSNFGAEAERSFFAIFIPNNCSFLVRCGGISGEFDRAMVRILARHSRAKIPIATKSERNHFVEAILAARYVMRGIDWSLKNHGSRKILGESRNLGVAN